MSECKTYRLGEIATFKYGKLPPKNSNIGQYPIWSGYRYVGYTSTFNCPKNSIIVIARGVGGTGDVKIAKEDCFLTNLSIIVNIDTSICNSYYFYYQYLLSNLKYLDSGSAQSQITIEDLKRLNIKLPSLILQNRTVKILKSFEDKIELNRRINANLEEQAQALFKSWFVDFEPFRDSPFVDSELGKIPQGWKVCRLKNATKEIIRGFTSKYVEKSDLINLNQKVNKGKYLDRQYYKYLNPQISIPSNKFACQNDILLNSLGQGTLGRVHYYGELTPNIVIDQHITIIRANDTTFQPSFIYLFLSSNEIQHSIEGMVTGSTGMQMLNISQVREMNILQPDVDTMNKFHRIVQPFFTKIRKNNTEIEIIANIRDTLLPKLMSGEISVEKGFTD